MLTPRSSTRGAVTASHPPGPARGSPRDAARRGAGASRGPVRRAHARAVADSGRLQDDHVARRQAGSHLPQIPEPPPELDRRGDGAALLHPVDPGLARLAEQSADAMLRAARYVAERKDDVLNLDPAAAFDLPAEKATAERINRPMQTALRRLDR